MADISVTAASVVQSSGATLRVLNAAEAIDAGETVVKDSNNDLVLTDATDTTKIACAGIAVCSAATGQPVVYATIDSALVLGTSITNGASILLSETPGKLTITLADLTTGSTPVFVGIGDGTTTIDFDATSAIDGLLKGAAVS